MQEQTSFVRYTRATDRWVSCFSSPPIKSFQKNQTTVSGMLANYSIQLAALGALVSHRKHAKGQLAWTVTSHTRIEARKKLFETQSNALTRWSTSPTPFAYLEPTASSFVSQLHQAGSSLGSFCVTHWTRLRVRRCCASRSALKRCDHRDSARANAPRTRTRNQGA